MVNETKPLGVGESPFSSNSVTGYSINFPIAKTCSPTTVCGATCYAGCGPITWSASLAKQQRNLITCMENPIAFANIVWTRAKKMGLDFIVWNGSGDLFAESVIAINHISKVCPEIRQWVRTRKPLFAGQINDSKNVFVHFSLDKDSLDRAERVVFKAKNHFFSYQYAPNEIGPYPKKCKVVFGHDYKMPEGITGKEVCPLNTLENIKGACVSCRRCFT